MSCPPLPTRRELLRLLATADVEWERLADRCEELQRDNQRLEAQKWELVDMLMTVGFREGVRCQARINAVEGS